MMHGGALLQGLTSKTAPASLCAAITMHVSGFHDEIPPGWVINQLDVPENQKHLLICWGCLGQSQSLQGRQT